MNLEAKIEAVLYAAAKPVSFGKLAEWCGATKDEIVSSLGLLTDRLLETESGLQLVLHEGQAELVTRPDAAELVRTVTKQDTQAELTRPSLEALAILAYRGPMTRPELEQIRGVQSSLILRNLMMRGLVEMSEDMRLGQSVYHVTIDFVKHLGIANTSHLPDYEKLHGNAVVEQVLRELEAPEKPGDESLTI